MAHDSKHPFFRYWLKPIAIAISLLSAWWVLSAVLWASGWRNVTWVTPPTVILLILAVGAVAWGSRGIQVRGLLVAAGCFIVTTMLVWIAFGKVVALVILAPAILLSVMAYALNRHLESSKQDGD